MSNPKERYENDPQYNQLCDMIESFLHQAQFTPSEVRECAVMAYRKSEDAKRFRPEDGKDWPPDRG